MISLAALAAAARADGVANASDQLRAEPSPTAPVVASVAANTRVQVLERKGFWAQVRTPQATGWLKLSSLTLDQRPADGGSALAALGGLATGRAGTGNIVATSGTRGLSAGDLRTATPDYASLAEAKQYSVPAAQAERYAVDGGLAPRSVAYVPASSVAPR